MHRIHLIQNRNNTISFAYIVASLSSRMFELKCSVFDAVSEEPIVFPWIHVVDSISRELVVDCNVVDRTVLISR